MNKTVKAKLFAVVVHDGNKVDEGHYFAYVKGKDNAWYCMNDQQVRTPANTSACASFVLKGGSIFSKWSFSCCRSTKSIPAKSSGPQLTW